MFMSRPWVTLNKKLAYQNPFMSIWKHQVRRDNGVGGNYYVLERSVAGRYFSIIIPLTDKFETILVGQYRYPVGCYSWEFPMGHAEGRNFLETAKIELKEETGIEAGFWQKIGRFFVAPGYSSEKAEVFVAKDLSFGEPKPTETEILQIRKSSVEQVKKMIENGEIFDGPTIAAYCLLTFYLKKMQEKNL